MVLPAEVVEAARNPNWYATAHNDSFETAIEQYIMVSRYGWPLVPIERHVCTQAMCLAVGLPAKLTRSILFLVSDVQLAYSDRE